jgi:2-C-methyl-D-erythritol 4-phosphate cytidylyltransferase/2-C-methyl-D-erythritol 2,4-cyclodiphosphate synthase
MNHAIILAAGQSQRMLSSTDKLLIKVANHPVIYYSLAAMNDHNLIDDIVLVVNKFNKDEIKKIVKEYNFSKVKLLALGGFTRQSSLEKGLQALQELKPKQNDLIVIHNGANPLPSYDEISQAVQEAELTNACIVGHKIKDTVKKIKGKTIKETIDREDLVVAQTPQVIRYALLKEAIKNAVKKGIEATDEAMLVEALGQKVSVVEAHENNFKITTKEDIQRLKFLLGEISRGFRIGIGQDSHPFSTTKKGLTLGGLYLEDEKKLEADSDGDVILHAIFNAISQAIGEHSLGFYADSLCKQGKIVDSKKYLDIMLEKIKNEKLEIGNLGLMIECKTPKIDPLSKKLKESLSKILNLNPKRIGVTATSGENLTSFGAGLGIQCFAIISLLEAKIQLIKKTSAKKTPVKKAPANKTPTKKPVAPPKKLTKKSSKLPNPPKSIKKNRKPSNKKFTSKKTPKTSSKR